MTTVNKMAYAQISRRTSTELHRLHRHEIQIISSAAFLRRTNCEIFKETFSARCHPPAVELKGLHMQPSRKTIP